MNPGADGRRRGPGGGSKHPGIFAQRRGGAETEPNLVFYFQTFASPRLCAKISGEETTVQERFALPEGIGDLPFQRGRLDR